MTQAKLLANPKFSSEWVKLGTEIIDTYNVPLEAIEDLSVEQLNVAKDIYDYIDGTLSDDDDEDELIAEKNAKYKNILNTILYKNKYNATQMQIIFIMCKSEADVELIEVLMDNTIPYGIMDYVGKGIIDGHKDMIKYIKGYSLNQVYEIYAGYVEGVDVSLYADAEIPAEIMGVIRHLLQLGINDEDIIRAIKFYGRDEQQVVE